MNPRNFTNTSDVKFLKSGKGQEFGGRYFAGRLIKAGETFGRESAVSGDHSHNRGRESAGSGDHSHNRGLERAGSGDHSHNRTRCGVRRPRTQKTTRKTES